MILKGFLGQRLFCTGPSTGNQVDGLPIDLSRCLRCITLPASASNRLVNRRYTFNKTVMRSAHSLWAIGFKYFIFLDRSASYLWRPWASEVWRGALSCGVSLWAIRFEHSTSLDPSAHLFSYFLRVNSFWSIMNSVTAPTGVWNKDAHTWRRGEHTRSKLTWAKNTNISWQQMFSVCLCVYSAAFLLERQFVLLDAILSLLRFSTCKVGW